MVPGEVGQAGEELRRKESAAAGEELEQRVGSGGGPRAIEIRARGWMWPYW